jgi:predicted HTH transcriptional regulator
VLEFKSTLQWDKAQNRANRALRQQVLKTVAAFMNTDGGTLVIGVEDDGNIYGLEQDLKLVGASRDRFEQTLVALVTDHLGAALAHYYRIRFEAVNGRDVCIIDVDPVRDPVFVRGERGQEFYTRVGNTTRALDPEETLRYREARVA